MGKPTSILQRLGSLTALSLSRLGMLVAPLTRQSHAAQNSGFVCAKAFKWLNALQQVVEVVSTLVVRKGKHDDNESFVARQLKPSTSFMTITVRSNKIAKRRKDIDTLFILPHCFISIIHFSFFFGWIKKYGKMLHL